ncbi:MAG: GNAT family N-acetyltransferase [Bacteroidetes bacterium]|nr:GNAT family N-acetyltransferase [Bacteroidota bacterium]
MDIKVRAATKKDAAALAGLVRQLAESEGKPSRFTRKDFIRDGLGHDRRFSAFVATKGNLPIGYAAFHEGYDLESVSKGLYLIDLFVRKEYRGQQVGTSLMKALAEKCKSSGSQWIAWNVSKNNADAIRFYESMKAKKNDSLQYWMSV